MASDVRRETNEDRLNHRYLWLNIREDKSAIEIRAAKRVHVRGPGQIICSDSFNRVFDCSIRVYRPFGPISRVGPIVSKTRPIFSNIFVRVY